MSSLKEFQHLRVPLEDIKLATNNFGETNQIGRGGFGMVYQGELVISEKPTMVALKRLNTSLGQGAREFWREIMMLSQYKHENLVSLLGFCDEGVENILVYEFLPNKSLDLYLSSPDLSWNQRLRICIGAAQGLEYLHEPAEGSQHRVLHRDIKSANILLDHKWNAKLADFGLSKFGPANQQFTFQLTAAVGTPGYCDPLYVETYFLTKESDVYSFGAVLLEVLCGRRCVEMIYKDDHRLLTRLAQKCYEENILDTIISTSLKEEISPECLERFSKIAYQCLKRERTERPTMTNVVTELQIALEYQEHYELDNSRFPVVAIYVLDNLHNVRWHIKTSMLSLGTIYTASLLFTPQIKDIEDLKITIKWKTKDLSVYTTNDAIETDDGWYSLSMWHFINHTPHSDFEVVIEELSNVRFGQGYAAPSLKVHGIEFRPKKMIESIEVYERYLMTDEVHMDIDDEEYWETKLPDGYQRLIEMSDEPLKCPTKKEFYLRLCEGFLGHRGQTRLWFSLCKSTCGICSMLPSTDFINYYYDFRLRGYIYTIPLSESRFHEVIRVSYRRHLNLECRLEPLKVSPHYNYACYLVFKYQYDQTLPDDGVLFEASCKLDDIVQGTMSACLNVDRRYNIPTIKPTNDSNLPIIPRNERVEMQKHYIHLGYSKIEERKDGWMEFMLCRPLRHLEDHKSLEGHLYGMTDNIMNGMIIEGIEFRPFFIN